MARPLLWIPSLGRRQRLDLDDWLPTLRRAADWNGWTLDDLLIQLAGHLKGRALQEWNLLSANEKKSYEGAVITFHIDGRVDLDITFQECTMKTPVYVKMDAKEQLLLSEGVCRQLGIMTYHGAVSPGQGEAEGVAGDGAGGEVYVPTVRVTLVQTVKFKPGGEAVVGVRLVSGNGGLSLKSVDQDGDGLPPMLLESDQQLQDTTGVKMSSSLVQPIANGFARVLLTNQLTLTHRLMEGTEIGYTTLVEVMETDSSENADQARVRTVTSDGMEDQT